MILENIAFPTPGFSDAPITAMDRGARKLLFDRVGLKEEDVDDKEDVEEVLVVEVMEKLNNITYKCVYPLSAYRGCKG
jgi:hypothetical protein